MPLKCCVPGCRSNYRGEGGYVTIFKFPQDEIHRHKWVKHIPQKDWQPCKRSVVCIKHFHVSDVVTHEHYTDSSGVKQTVKRGAPRLKEGAYPAVFPGLAPYLFCDEVPKHKSPEERRAEIDDCNITQMCDSTAPYVTPKLEIKEELIDLDLDIYSQVENADQVNHVSDSNNEEMCNYYEATQLQLKDELQDHLDDMLCHALDPTSEEDPLKLRELLVITIRTLKGVKEQLDTVTELRHMERFGLKRFQGNDDDILFWTGFGNYSSIVEFYEKMVEPCIWNMREQYWKSSAGQEVEREGQCTAECLLLPIDEMFLTLIKLKRDSANKDLAERFQICEFCVHKFFVMWILFLHSALDKVDTWMSKQEVKKDIPMLFKSLYADVRTVVYFVEVESDRPCDTELQAACFSHYRQRKRMKGMIGCSPSGKPTFVSDLFDGTISESQILFDSGLIRKLNARDALFSHQVFTNREELARYKIRLIVPPFLTADDSATVQSAVNVDDRVRVCRHINRLIDRIKECQILDHKVSMRYWHHIDSIFKVCAKLMLYWPGLVEEAKTDAFEMLDD